ncbi:hypothetical protein CEXT_698161 [Caerostris extrusa]|uniref:Uncharacterized protein n=1 Tax=Caerostris extrusa TaxID=172846 RepID=A0AAV4S0X3_CAEEX|nr:hypothetical protein CEXT_698161 [Caerostris extrusa]
MDEEERALPSQSGFRLVWQHLTHGHQEHRDHLSDFLSSLRYVRAGIHSRPWNMPSAACNCLRMDPDLSK